MTKSEELLNKHLELVGGKYLGIKDGNIYEACINAINEAINYSQCCTELNNCLQKGDSAYIYENAIVDIISVLPNNEYIVKDFSGIQFTADKKDLTKII